MKIGLLFGSFAGGGAERMMVNLAKGFLEEGYNPVVYVVNKSGPYKKEVPANISVVDLNASYGVKSIFFKIRNILKENELDALISTQEHVNAVVGFASIGLKIRPQIIFREANTPTQRNYSLFRKWSYKYAYMFADKYVAVSNGVKKDIIQHYGLNSKDVRTIYNPVVDESLFKLKEEQVDDLWFQEKDKHPVIVGMGRVVPQKGFEDLIEALAHVRKNIPARLMIFGNTDADPKYFTMLKEGIKNLGLEDHVRFRGFVDNPFKFLKNASLFVLSSKYEGLPGVLIQALACGCPVVSTDCPSGPREILKNGEYGKLVEVAKPKKLARSIVDTLKEPNQLDELEKRGKFFSINNAVSSYNSIISKNSKDEKY